MASPEVWEEINNIKAMLFQHEELLKEVLKELKELRSLVYELEEQVEELYQRVEKLEQAEYVRRYSAGGYRL